MSKEIKDIEKISDGTYLITTYEKPLREQIKQKDQKIAELEARIKELERQLNSKTLSFIPNGAMSIKDTAEENSKIMERLIRRQGNND